MERLQGEGIQPVELEAWYRSFGRDDNGNTTVCTQALIAAFLALGGRFVVARVTGPVSDLEGNGAGDLAASLVYVPVRIRARGVTALWAGASFLCVQPKLRGQGLGHKIISTAYAEAKDRGIIASYNMGARNRMWVREGSETSATVRQWMRPIAFRLCRKLGFDLPSPTKRGVSESTLYSLPKFTGKYVRVTPEIADACYEEYNALVKDETGTIWAPTLEEWRLWAQTFPLFATKGALATIGFFLLREECVIMGRTGKEATIGVIMLTVGDHEKNYHAALDASKCKYVALYGLEYIPAQRGMIFAGATHIVRRGPWIAEGPLLMPLF